MRELKPGKSVNIGGRVYAAGKKTKCIPEDVIEKYNLPDNIFLTPGKNEPEKPHSDKRVKNLD